MSSAASSSSARARPPAAVSSSVGSAEQPATSLHLKISSICDVQAWLNGEQVAGCSSADAQRIRDAVAVLSHPRPRKEDVQPLLGPKNWDVAQKKDKKPRPLGDMLQDFQGKVIKAAQKLQQQLRDSVAQSASSTTQQPVRMEEASRQQTASSSAEQPVC